MGTRTFVNKGMAFSPAKRMARGMDIPLILVVVALVVFGLIMLYSASFDFSFNEFGSPTHMFARQVRWLGLGILLALGFSLFDYHHWRQTIVFAMLGTVGLLVTVLFVNEIRLQVDETANDTKDHAQGN